ncbi:SGNH/GDSL hydrolase family protein [Nocardioides sp. NPDC126508]
MKGLLRLPGRVSHAAVVMRQAVHVKRTALRLPPAEGTTGTVGTGEPTFRVAVVGDSLAAGIGLSHHSESIAGRLAQLLAETHGATVSWQVQAEGGLTAGGVSALLDRDRLTQCDAVVVSVGVNDTKDLHSRSRWRRELGELLDQVTAAAPSAKVVLLAVPPMEHFPALPAQLAQALGNRARVMDQVAAEVVARRLSRVRRIEVELTNADGTFSADGFHPSTLVHTALAEKVVEVLAWPLNTR